MNEISLDAKWSLRDMLDKSLEEITERMAKYEQPHGREYAACVAMLRLREVQAALHAADVAQQAPKRPSRRPRRPAPTPATPSGSLQGQRWLLWWRS